MTDNIVPIAAFLFRVVAAAWLLRGAFAAFRGNEARITSSGAMATAFYIGSIAIWKAGAA